MDKVVHFEIPADDIQRANRFYSNVFGWQIAKAPMPDMEYYMATTVPVDEQMMPKEAGAINGAITPKDDAHKSPVIVIDVESVDQSLQKVTAAGGKVVMPKVQVADMGLYAIVADTEGNVIGVWQDLGR